MREKIQQNDYVGFTFNNTHSSQLGIIRVSNGSRFNENLLPTIQDKTVPIPGRDGTYYFGSHYTQKRFEIQFAFEDLTELEFAELKKWLGDKQIHDLYFDEAPYKAYQAKITGNATIKYIPFSEENKRVYKGEGSIQFTAYYPYAKSRYKFLEDCNDYTYNLNEWKDASGLKERNGGQFKFDELLNGNKICLYNPGDLDTHFQLILKFNLNDTIPQFGIAIDEHPGHQARFSAMKRQSGDEYVCIDTKLNLIEGLNANFEKTGNVYNKYMLSGHFFKIPMSKEVLTMQFDSMKENETIEVCEPIIKYNFYYF